MRTVNKFLSQADGNYDFFCQADENCKENFLVKPAGIVNKFLSPADVNRE